jgi:four helix bundle protein
MALRVIRLAQSLPRNLSGKILGAQLIRAATSAAANYRAACKARSRSEFLSKLGIVEEEADETQFWIEMIIESGLMKEHRVKNLLAEVRELTAIIAASRITVKGYRKYQTDPRQ